MGWAAAGGPLVAQCGIRSAVPSLVIHLPACDAGTGQSGRGMASWLHHLSQDLVCDTGGTSMEGHVVFQ